jgi:arylsulfatase A-like enzyme
MRPNILLLQCHDLGDHLACYDGNSAHTPHLDRLAAEGVVFEQNFSAAPTCSPSQGAMLTGLMPHRNGLMALASGGHWEMGTGVPTLPQLLQDAGYTTACFGTWHISAEFWDRGVEEGNQDADCEKSAANATRYLHRYLQEPQNRPFFLMVSFGEPHRPFTDAWPNPQDPEQVSVPAYLDDVPEVRREMACFYGGVSHMDAAAGQVLDALWECGLDENTLVVFTSDHGIGMPLAKGTLYDPGLKIPFIVSWHGRVQGERRCGDLTSNVDVLPTILDAAGVHNRIPPDLDGHSLWPFVERGEGVAHEWIFAEQTWHDFYEPMRAIRTVRYKLVRNFEPGTGLQIAADILYSPTVDAMRGTLRNWPRPEWEFYDLEQDPWERNNLAGNPNTAEIERALARELDDWLARTNDPILKGVVPAPMGYWEHFCAKPVGPGGLPSEPGREGWLTMRWPPGAIEHCCLQGKRQGRTGRETGTPTFRVSTIDHFE